MLDADEIARLSELARKADKSEAEHGEVSELRTRAIAGTAAPVPAFDRDGKAVTPPRMIDRARLRSLK